MADKELNEKLTSDKPEHTPLPWKVCYYTHTTGSVAIIGPTAGLPIANMTRHYSDCKLGNAELIVKGANNHQRLLDTCKFAARVIGDIKKHDPNNAGKWFAAQRQIQAAIDATEKECR